MKKMQPVPQPASPSVPPTSQLESDLKRLMAAPNDHSAILTLIREMAAMEAPVVLYTALPAYNSD
jgi:hypothetical protein